VSSGTKIAIAQNLLGLRFSTKKATSFFMYYQMKNYKFVHDVNARLIITVQASIKRKDLETIDLLLPPIGVQEAFSTFVEPLIDKQRSGHNIKLGTLRDTLLPKLLSGKLRIPDAEKIMAEAL
jgi:type I restriction enzyme S subunit